MRIYLLFLCCFCFLLGQAQNQQNAELSDLYFYSDVMINAESYTNRLRAHKKFSELLEQKLESKDSWDMGLENIPFIHSLVSPDSLFKIYTYYIADDKNTSSESGYIQMKSGELFKLEPTNYFEDIEFNENSYDDWLAGIYYHMIPFTHKGENMYILFSFSQPTPYEKRKVIDVLRFVDGKPVFGAEVFKQKEKGIRDIVHTRRMYTYSADVSMVIQYDKDFDAILIDHLMEVKSRMPGSNKNTAVPDGTYTSYKLEKGEWIYNDMVFDPSNNTPAGEVKKEVEKPGLFGQTPKSKN